MRKGSQASILPCSIFSSMARRSKGGYEYLLICGNGRSTCRFHVPPSTWLEHSPKQPSRRTSCLRKVAQDLSNHITTKGGISSRARCLKARKQKTQDTLQKESLSWSRATTAQEQEPVRGRNNVHHELLSTAFSSTAVTTRANLPYKGLRPIYRHPTCLHGHPPSR